METKNTNDSLTKIGVLADTHGRAFNALYEALADCDHIIHAGDIGDPGIIRQLRSLAPVTAVLGNNDFNEYGSSVSYSAKLHIAGVRIFVSHYPEDVTFEKQMRNHFEPGEPLPHICIHGHTHVPRLVITGEAYPAQLLLCPGSPCFPRLRSRCSIAKIVLADGEFKLAWHEEV